LIDLEKDELAEEKVVKKHSRMRQMKAAKEEAERIKNAIERHEREVQAKSYEARTTKLIIDNKAKLGSLAEKLQYERKAEAGNLCEWADWRNLNNVGNDLICSVIQMRASGIDCEEMVSARKNAKEVCDILFQLNTRVWDTVFMEQAEMVTENALARIKTFLEESPVQAVKLSKSAAKKRTRIAKAKAMNFF
jgi:hypothetical protein